MLRQPRTRLGKSDLPRLAAEVGGAARVPEASEEPGSTLPGLHAFGAAGAQGAGLKPGAQVTLRGLTKRPELNGRVGLLETFDAAAQRWLVHLDGSDAVKLKPENLEALGKVSFLQKS